MFHTFDAYRIKKGLVVLITLFLSGFLSAQYAFNVFTKDDGLISDEVTCTYRDSRGFLWIGTRQGLQIYNGKNFKTLQHHVLDSNSLSGDWVMAIAEDADGYIWAGTDKGICKIHPGHLKCSRYKPGVQMPADVMDAYCKVIADDNGVIWALTSNYLLCFKEDRFLATDPVSYHGYMARGKKNELIVVCQNHLFIKHATSGNIEEPVKEETLDYTSAYKDIKGNYWLGSWGNGLFFYNSEWGSRQNFKWDLNPVNPSATNIILGISGDSANVYIGTNFGLFVYSLKGPIDINHPTLHLNFDPQVQHGISSGMVGHILVDPFNNIWLSTANGLNVSLALNREYTDLADDVGLITDVEWSNDNLITTSWYGKGLCFFDRNLGLTTSMQYLPEDKKELNNSQISGLDLTNQNQLWVATFNGLVNYDLEKKRTLLYLTKENAGFATNHLNDVWINKAENEIWTANYDAGITRYNLTTGKVTNLNTSNHPVMMSDLVWKFYDTGNGVVWILTNAGLLQYNYITQQWKGWTTANYLQTNIAMGRTQAILHDSHGTVWLGTENGLFIYANNRWYFKGIENGLPERSINGIVEDDEGNIWLGFNNSIVQYNTITSSAFILSTSNGILLPDIHFIFTNPGKDRLFMASIHQIFEINKEQILANHLSSPLVYLEKFLINGKSFYSNNTGFEIEKKEFSFDQNNVEIGFITPHIGEIGKLLYSYRINNGAWSAPSDNNELILPQLQSGAYQIEIRATTDGTHWTEKPLVISFVVHPPFWATWWFRLLVVAALLSLVVWWVRFLSTRKMRLKILQLEKEQAVEKERSRLSRDMHDDLGSGLTKISILSEVVKKKIGSENQVDTYLENISDSSRELVQNLNNIIWSLNPGNDTLQALLAYTREYAAQFLESCEVNFEYHSNAMQVDREVSEQAKRNIFLVVKETLNNAVKHGKAANISIHAEWKEPAQLSISIQDDGVGFDPATPSKGNGLKNMERRMKEIGGSFMIQRGNNKGTRVILTYVF